MRSVPAGLREQSRGQSPRITSYNVCYTKLLRVLFLVLAYFFAYRMTRDLSKLNNKAKNLSGYKQESLVSNIVDVKNLDKTFESLKAELRRLETDLDEAIKSSEYKSVFLANMSYEIRTPLNSVLGMINMLKQSELTTEQQIQLEIAEYSSEHVLQLVTMILDNSKVEGGKVELELSAIDLKLDRITSYNVCYTKLLR